MTTATSTSTPTFTPTHTPTPLCSRGDIRVNSKDDAVYAYVPAGEFTMGSTYTDTLALDNERPQGTVYLDGFWIMQKEVTNAQYKRCVDAGVCTPPNNSRWNDPESKYADHPVTDVDWAQANAYARWVGGACLRRRSGRRRAVVRMEAATPGVTRNPARNCSIIAAT